MSMCALALPCSDCLHDEQDFGGRSGFWKLTYHDEDLRILYTNQGNVFVLQRAE